MTSDLLDVLCIRNVSTPHLLKTDSHRQLISQRFHPISRRKAKNFQKPLTLRETLLWNGASIRWTKAFVESFQSNRYLIAAKKRTLHQRRKIVNMNYETKNNSLYYASLPQISNIIDIISNLPHTSGSAQFLRTFEKLFKTSLLNIIQVFCQTVF